MSRGADPDRSERIRKTLSRVAALGLLAAGFAGFYWLYFASGMTLEPEMIREQIGEFGIAAPLIFSAMVAFRFLLLLPSFVVLAAGGLLFGAVWGAVWGTIGGAIGAGLTFFVARNLGRDALVRWFPGPFAHIDRYQAARGPVLLGAYCAYPATPLTPAFLGAGLTSMRPVPFLIASTIGLLPRTIVYSSLGDAVFELDWIRFALVLGIAALAVLAAAPARRWLFRLPDEPES
ncbi:MAG: TVP38/TMEM64 family protein [Myxococcales bacterium]|nr:TVP38/TMEM64 family protein [Myxococcales bacterium]